MASYDLAVFRIPNPLTAGAALLGLASALATAGVAGLGEALLGGLTAFGLMAFFFFVGAVGAGDVKALGALGTFLTPWCAMELFVLTALAGGVLAVLRVVLAGRGLAAMGGGLAAFKESSAGLKLPYGLAIFGGAVLLNILGGVPC